MAAAEAAKKALWLAGLVKELGIQQGRVSLHCDSQSAIHLAKNQVYHARTKHIDVRFHKIRELVATAELLLEKIHTSENAIDMLTKPITTDKFKHCLDLTNVSRCYKGEERRRQPQTYQFQVEAQYLVIFKEVNTRQGGDCWNKWFIFY
jgi:hypothetical protein